jgi:hypothetical protein
MPARGRGLRRAAAERLDSRHMRKKTYHSFIFLDQSVKERILAIMKYGNNPPQSVGFFRVAVGLYYLSKIMVEDELDFKAIDAEFNRFIFETIGRGHSITSVLQYMSSRNVLRVLESKSFISHFLNYFSEIPFRNILLLLSINLSVSKKISRLTPEGPLQDWIVRQGKKTIGSEQAQPAQDAPAA